MEARHVLDDGNVEIQPVLLNKRHDQGRVEHLGGRADLDDRVGCHRQIQFRIRAAEHEIRVLRADDHRHLAADRAALDARLVDDALQLRGRRPPDRGIGRPRRRGSQQKCQHSADEAHAPAATVDRNDHAPY